MIKTIKNIAILTFSTFLYSISHVQGRVTDVLRYDQQILDDDGVPQPCSAYNALESVPTNARCSTMITPTGLKCFINCTCLQGYKKSDSGECIAKTCADYDEFSSEAEDITRQSTIVTRQLGDTIKTCYQKGLCAAGYKEGASASEPCIEKSCIDYGYQSTTCTSDREPVAHSVKLGSVSATCYDCSGCNSAYRYSCYSSTSIASGSGTSCDAKYKSCTCKTEYVWDSGSGSCEKLCTPCDSKAYPLTKAQTDETTASYNSCTPSNCTDNTTRYAFKACKTGYYDVSACYKNNNINYGPLSYWTRANMGL
jgi:hypothetical protein